MPYVSTLIQVTAVIQKYFSEAEFITDKQRLLLTFTESAFGSMAANDKKIMSRYGWRYDHVNDYWSINTEEG